MQTQTPTRIHDLRVKPNLSREGVFEVKTREGRALGFIVNGAEPGPTLVIAGAGQASRGIFQQALLWPSLRELNGRLALILLDRLDTSDAAATVKEVCAMLRPVKDMIFLPTSDIESFRVREAGLGTIRSFCERHGCLDLSEPQLDCASL